jgi:deazaflavin-dependent oxidoreductase (nitroreductase family)
MARFGLRHGLAPRAFGLLETTGRRSGQPRQTPVGGLLDGDSYWLVSEHGTGCAYVLNLVANREVRIKVRRRWYAGEAELLPDDDTPARRRAIVAGTGLLGRADGVFFRVLSSQPVTVRIRLR